MMIGSVLIFGSLGLVVRGMTIPSGAAAVARGLIGAVFLAVLFALSGRRVAWGAARQNLPLLALSGALLGANWIFLFEAYRYTTIALATLSYYLAPVILTAASPLLLKEKLSARKALCVGAALLGMALISGILGASQAGINPRGILMGLSAAVCYASLTLTNKFLRDIRPMEATIFQLLFSSAVLAPYALLTGQMPFHFQGAQDVLLLIVMGVVHTGVAFWWYFASVRALRAQTVAMLSYIDPATAILLSTAVLGERMNLLQILGACLILGAALTAEMPAFPARRAGAAVSGQNPPSM